MNKKWVVNTKRNMKYMWSIVEKSNKNVIRVLWGVERKSETEEIFEEIKMTSPKDERHQNRLISSVNLKKDKIQRINIPSTLKLLKKKNFKAAREIFYLKRIHRFVGNLSTIIETIKQWYDFSKSFKMIVIHFSKKQKLTLK